MHMPFPQEELCYWLQKDALGDCCWGRMAGFTMRRLMTWAIRYNKYDRQWKHVNLELVPPEEDVPRLVELVNARVDIGPAARPLPDMELG